MADHDASVQNSLEEMAVFGLGCASEQEGTATSAAPDVRSPLGEKVRATVKGILGARIRPEDPKGFKASLNQSFIPYDANGHHAYKWMPRSYSIEVERGMLTGAQASIHTRAHRALEHSLALLDGLDPRSCGHSEEEFESARAVVRGQLTELVDELGQPGGPRPGRVDVLFDQLNGQVEQLKQALGFDSIACTVEDEEIATNLDIVQDYVRSLETNWRGARRHFLRSGGNRYVGNVHYHLKRHLAVMVESIDEANRIMNKALLGPRERETLLLPLYLHRHDKGRRGCTDRCQKQEMYLSDLLTWVEHFGSREALRLLGEGGCYGGQVVQSTLRRLTLLTADAVRLSCAGSDDKRLEIGRCAPAAFYSGRVRFALQQVHDHVRQASTLADGLPAPPRRTRPQEEEECEAENVELEDDQICEDELGDLRRDDYDDEPVYQHDPHEHREHAYDDEPKEKEPKQAGFQSRPKHTASRSSFPNQGLQASDEPARSRKLTGSPIGVNDLLAAQGYAAGTALPRDFVSQIPLQVSTEIEDTSRIESEIASSGDIATGMGDASKPNGVDTIGPSPATAESITAEATITEPIIADPTTSGLTTVDSTIAEASITEPATAEPTTAGSEAGGPEAIARETEPTAEGGAQSTPDQGSGEADSAKSKKKRRSEDGA